MRDTLACDDRLEATTAASAAEVNKILKNAPPTNSAISGRVSSVTSKPSRVGNTAWPNHAAIRKIAPPMSSAKTMALGTVSGVLASSLYIVIASNPMNEKHTTVAPANTAPTSTPAWYSGFSVKMVPSPMPSFSASQASTTKVAMSTTWNTTRIPLTRDVPFILRKLKAVITPTYTRTNTHDGASGKNDSK